MTGLFGIHAWHPDNFGHLMYQPYHPW